MLPAGDVVVIQPNHPIVFDTVTASGGLGAQIDYDMTTGTITFLDAGIYCIDWFVAPQFGLTTDGSNWAIETSISGLRIICSSHTKVSVTAGFALIDAAAGETAQLVNVSSGALYLSQAVQSKAGLVAYRTGG